MVVKMFIQTDDNLHIGCWKN